MIKSSCFNDKIARRVIGQEKVLKKIFNMIFEAFPTDLEPSKLYTGIES